MRQGQVSWDAGPSVMALAKTRGAWSLQQEPHPPDQPSHHTGGAHSVLHSSRQIVQRRASGTDPTSWKWGKVAHRGHECII